MGHGCPFKEIIMQIIDQLFNMAIDNDNNPHRTRFAACLVIRDTPIAWGFNYLKSHPFQAQYAKNRHAIFWHAETNCIHNALRRVPVEKLKNSTLYVVRAKRDIDRKTWIRGLASPCCGCMEAIIEHKISRVIFTAGVGDLAEINLTKS